jgi:hypothetical protein
VRDYLAHLTAAARRRAKARTGRSVASLEEVLTYCTQVMRANVADYLDDNGELNLEKLREVQPGVIRRLELSTTDAEGRVSGRHKLEMESALTAAQTLIRHYEATETPGRSAP